MSTALVLRLPWPSSPRSRYLLASAAAHALFLTAVLLLPQLAARRRPPAEAPLVVDLIGASPAAPPRRSPPKAKAEPAPPAGDHAAARDVRPEPKTERKPEPKAEKPPPRPPEPSSPAPAAEGPAAAGAGAAPAAGGGIASLDLGDLEHAWYRDSVVAALQSRWVRPILEGASGSLEVTVAFEIARDGTVLHPRVEQGSGVAALDRSALRAVIDASPFPPLPSSWREPVAAARIAFRLNPGEEGGP